MQSMIIFKRIYLVWTFRLMYMMDQYILAYILILYGHSVIAPMYLQSTYPLPPPSNQNHLSYELYNTCKHYVSYPALAIINVYFCHLQESRFSAATKLPKQL